jgi:asparagine synthase (glutamine-hydrolysing)
VRAGRLSPVRDLDTMLAQQDEPFYAPNLFLHEALYDAARAAGVRVLLDGLDGDTTVSHGIGYLRELAGAGRWLHLLREVRGLSRQLKIPAWRILLAKVVKPMLRSAVRRTTAPPVDLIAPELARRVGLADRLRALDPARRPPPRTEREDHHRTLGMGLLPLVLEIADRAAGARGLEPRYPFFDRRLVELCLALPGDQKLDHGWTRVVLRRAMEGVLPRSVQWRIGKTDLSPNFLRGMLDGAARPAIERLLRDGAQVGPYVDLKALRTAYQRARSPGGESSWPAITVWKVLTLNRWLELANVGPAHQEVAYEDACGRSDTPDRAGVAAAV